MLGADLVGLERGEAREAHVEDRLRLLLGELESLNQAVAGGVRVGRAADQLNHRVEVVERDEQSLENVRPGLGSAQLVLGPAGDDLSLVDDVVVDELLQREGARHPVDQRHHVEAEGLLELGALVEVVGDDVRVGAPLELDHDAHPGAVGLVAQVGDPLQLLVADQIGDLRDQTRVAALLDHERQLRDDESVLAALERLRVHPPAHPHAAPTRGVGVADALHAHDPAAREVGALDVLHQAGDIDLGVLDVSPHRPANLGEIVRRDIRRHPHGDPGRAIDEQVGETRRQRQRLLLGLVVVGPEVDGVGLDLAQHLGGEARQTRLGVTHRGRRIVVDRAEVALAVNERVAQGEVLRHPRQGVVDRRVAVRVVLTHHLADDEGRLPVRAVRLEAEIVHRVQHPAVDGLQPVAHVGKSPADDHAHRVIEVRRAHLLRELALLDVARQGRESAFHQ